MLKGLLGSLRGSAERTPTPAASVATVPAPEGTRPAPPPRAPIAPLRDEPEPELPPVPALIDAWRAEVARTTIGLRERYPMHDHAERLLVKLAVDLDLAIRLPPAAAQEALAVVADPSSDLAALVRVLERDPLLCRALLRHAGSALFASAGPPASVGDAVRRLGAQGVQAAVLAGMAECLMQRVTGPYVPLAQQVWGHLQRSGPRARALARAFGVPAQEAFTLGLLHDVGKLVLFDLLSALQQALRRDVLLPEGMGEEAMTRMHEPLGGITLLRWGVGVRGASAVAHHHRRGEPPATRDARSELLYVAERLHRALRTGRPPDVEGWCRDGQLRTAPERVTAGIEAVQEAAEAEPTAAV
jgi:HD-like signal output (HDOD) protein